MPTPVPSSRPPEVEHGPKKKKDPDSTHELPTLQMPALDIPTAPDVDWRSSGRMPVVEPPSPDEDADFDVRETQRMPGPGEAPKPR